MRKIETAKAPAALGPYSQAISVEVKSLQQLVFVSGQLPIDPAAGKIVSGGIAEAATQVLNNIEAILSAANCGFEHVVRVDIFLRDLNDFQQVNEIYKQRFTSPVFPARQTVQVARLPLDASIEISCIAIRN